MKRSILITVFLLLLTLRWAAVPAAAQSEAWVATYFANNNSLSGSPSLIQTEYNANFGYNWGTGSPHPAIPVDNFSARCHSASRLPFSSRSRSRSASSR